MRCPAVAGKSLAVTNINRSYKRGDAAATCPTIYAPPLSRASRIDIKPRTSEKRVPRYNSANFGATGKTVKSAVGATDS